MKKTPGVVEIGRAEPPGGEMGIHTPLLSVDKINTLGNIKYSYLCFLTHWPRLNSEAFVFVKSILERIKPNEST